MRNAVAFANNDIVTIAWSYGKRPDGCMGFALYRIDTAGKETPLPSHAVFKGEMIQHGQTTEKFPVQKFYWKDPYARPIGEQTRSTTFRYKVVPLEGKPGELKPMTSLPILTTNEVTLTPVCSRSVSAVFNRGIISTQHVANALKGQVAPNSLKANISQPGNQLRNDLAGDMIATLTAFLNRVKKDGDEVYAALYELTDVELIKGLVNIGDKLNIIVANIVAATPKDGTTAGPGENDPAWNKIHPLCKDTSFYRQPPSNHIVHNKFLIFANKSGPQAVLTGSTNWTDTGLCAQTNNALIIDDPNVASRYFAYWNKLKADQIAHQKDPQSFQAAQFRTFDGSGKNLTLDNGTGNGSESILTSYFSPNTPKARSKSKTTAEVTPVDMKDLSDRINQAKHAVLFLAFIPGTPSITEFAAARQLLL